MSATTYIDEATLRPVSVRPLEREPGTVQRYVGSDGAIWTYHASTRSVTYLKRAAR